MTKIQELSNENQWRHVIPKDNPADAISRGMDPATLKNCSLWWNGPVHLLHDIAADPCSFSQQELKVLHSTSLLCPKNSETANFLSNFLNCTNSFFKLIRIFSFLFRFIHNCKIKIGRRKGPISTSEFNDAVKSRLCIIQHQEFAAEVNALKNGNTLKHNTLLGNC